MQTFLTDFGDGGRNRFLDQGENAGEFGLAGGVFSKTLRSPKHFIGVSADSGPSEGANLIDDVSGMGATGCQISALENEVGSGALEVGENGLEAAAIAVNIGYDRGSHLRLVKEEWDGKSTFPRIV